MKYKVKLSRQKNKLAEAIRNARSRDKNKFVLSIKKTNKHAYVTIYNGNKLNEVIAHANTIKILKEKQDITRHQSVDLVLEKVVAQLKEKGVSFGKKDIITFFNGDCYNGCIKSITDRFFQLIDGDSTK